MSCLLTEEQDMWHQYTVREDQNEKISLKASHKPHSKKKSHIRDKKDHVQCQLPT